MGYAAPINYLVCKTDHPARRGNFIQGYRMVRVFAAAFLSAGLLGLAPAHAQNVALATDGASFVSASSALNPGDYGLSYINGGLATAEANLLTTTPTVFLNDNDTRYLFADSDTGESVTIDLGQSTAGLVSFGATWYTQIYQDRAPTSVAVWVSATGLPGSFTEVAATATLPYGGDEALLTLAAPVTAQYIMYDFGGSGTGIDELFADVPEPSSTAAILAGLGALAFARRRRTTPAR
jgi:hypothetical protein